jgi:nicotinamidase-related amidase
MPINLDPDTTALLVIDVQNGLFSKPNPIYKEQELLENINALNSQFSLQGSPVFFIQHSNQKLLMRDSENWRFHPKLEIGEDDPVIHKTYGNAFEETRLKDELDACGIKNVVVTGLVTNGCVRATSIGAHDLGYRVILVEDGHSTYVRNAAKLIEEWNTTLGKEIAEVHPASAIHFEKQPN